MVAVACFVALVVVGGFIGGLDLARHPSSRGGTGLGAASVEVDLRSAPLPSRSSSRGYAEPDPAWVDDLAARTGIPAPAVRAYARAELGGGGGCGVGWTTLAGLGWVESHHGTLDGRRLLPSGRSSRAVVGPALDGRGPVAAIPAAPGSAALHGDDVWEHAVGPLQFLPSSWDTWGTDGDGDARVDVHDLDDGAAAAAAYLCAAGTDLTTDSGWSSAVRTYNHSDAYVAAVSTAASRYATASRP